MSDLPDRRPRPWRLSFDLPLDLTAPATARCVVDSVLRQWGVVDADVLASCSIVVSELVTNALSHTGDDGGTATLELDRDGGSLRLAVVDGSDLVPRMRAADETDTGGRGLAIVEQLSLRWGTEPVPGGKRVYAELPAGTRDDRRDPGGVTELPGVSA